MPDLASLERFLAGCPRCKLSGSRTRIVFGAGNPRADLMFVGEAPGREEDEQGLPFVGAAGGLLTKIIEAMGTTRDDVYIVNTVRPTTATRKKTKSPRAGRSWKSRSA
jgi:DNA polymerase